MNTSTKVDRLLAGVSEAICRDADGYRGRSGWLEGLLSDLVKAAREEGRRAGVQDAIDRLEREAERCRNTNVPQSHAMDDAAILLGKMRRPHTSKKKDQR